MKSKEMPFFDRSGIFLINISISIVKYIRKLALEISQINLIVQFNSPLFQRCFRCYPNPTNPLVSDSVFESFWALKNLQISSTLFQHSEIRLSDLKGFSLFFTYLNWRWNN